MHVRHADYAHVIHNTITLILCPPDSDLEPLVNRQCTRVNKQVRRKQELDGAV